MANDIHIIKNRDIENIKLFNNDHLAILDGHTIKTKSDLLAWLGQTYQLPNWSNWDAVSDWMTDLSWLGADAYHLIIKDREQLLSEDDTAAKSIFFKLLVESILPYWEKEVLYVTAGGLPKSFQLYLVVD